jgi:hypothetical protein
MGVAEGSTETTERTGKMRSVALGLRAESLGPEVGFEGESVLPENMLTVLVFGVVPIADLAGGEPPRAAFRIRRRWLSGGRSPAGSGGVGDIK